MTTPFIPWYEDHCPGCNAPMDLGYQQFYGRCGDCHREMVQALHFRLTLSAGHSQPFTTCNVPAPRHRAGRGRAKLVSYREAEECYVDLGASDWEIDL